MRLGSYLLIALGTALLSTPIDDQGTRTVVALGGYFTIIGILIAAERLTES